MNCLPCSRGVLPTWTAASIRRPPWHDWAGANSPPRRLRRWDVATDGEALVGCLFLRLDGDCGHARKACSRRALSRRGIERRLLAAVGDRSGAKWPARLAASNAHRTLREPCNLCAARTLSRRARRHDPGYDRPTASRCENRLIYGVMIRATTVIRAGHWSGVATDAVVLGFDERHRRRLAMKGRARSGVPALIFPKRRHSEMATAWFLRTAAWSRCAPRPNRCWSSPRGTRITWRVSPGISATATSPAAIEKDRILIRPDHVLAEMLDGLGAEFPRSRRRSTRKAAPMRGSMPGTAIPITSSP